MAGTIMSEGECNGYHDAAEKKAVDDMWALCGGKQPAGQKAGVDCRSQDSGNDEAQETNYAATDDCVKNCPGYDFVQVIRDVNNLCNFVDGAAGTAACAATCAPHHKAALDAAKADCDKTAGL